MKNNKPVSQSCAVRTCKQFVWRATCSVNTAVKYKRNLLIITHFKQYLPSFIKSAILLINVNFPCFKRKIPVTTCAFHQPENNTKQQNSRFITIRASFSLENKDILKSVCARLAQLTKISDCQPEVQGSIPGLVED